jgi:hypothetical protein
MRCARNCREKAAKWELKEMCGNAQKEDPLKNCRKRMCAKKRAKESITEGTTNKATA